MEQKYAAYTSQGLETFADPRTAIEMGNLLLLNHVAREIARSVHHIIKEPAQAQQLIEQFYEEHFRHMQAQSLLMHESFVSGATAPLALTVRRRKNSVDEMISAPFDYHTLDIETRQFVQQKADETHGLLKRTAEHILRVGQNLKAVKEKLPHGQFLLWIEAEFEMSRWTANNFIHVADKLEDKWRKFIFRGKTAHSACSRH